jgi:hypothetical protein
VLSWIHTTRGEQVTQIKDLSPDNLRNLLRALETQNRRQPTRETMAKIKAVKAELKRRK